MDKFKMSQILKLIFMATLLCITPLLSTTLRPPYLYFVVNILIFALGAEAGLLSFICKTRDQDKKFTSSTTDNINVAQKPAAHADAVVSSEDISVSNKERISASNATGGGNAKLEAEAAAKKLKPKAIEKSSSEKIVGVSSRVHKVVKKSPSMPSLFFIGAGGDQISNEEEGGGELDDEFVEDQLYDDDSHKLRLQDGIGGDQEISGQELFQKAETFIGNFYKQLKMQREESWKKIHGFYHKAF